MAHLARVVLCIGIAAALHGLVWLATSRSIQPPDITGSLASLSYTPPTANWARQDISVDVARIDQDLARLATLTHSIRTYSAAGSMEAVPSLAAKHGLSVTLGAWIGRNPERNNREIGAALNATKTHANIRGLIVGNESLLRGDITVPALIKHLKTVRTRTLLPLTTAEPWHVWLQHPELADAVDYVSAHILPYWEGLPPEQAVAYAATIYDRLQETFPDKKIVIAEFGWPSDGYNLGAALPGHLLQADVIRRFLAHAQRRGIDYNLIEAYDQPWKTAEGRVGPHWGLLTADGRQKFQLEGPVTIDRHAVMSLALSLGAIIALVLLLTTRHTVAHGVVMATAANLVGGGAALAILYPASQYLSTGETAFWLLGLGLLIPLAALSLVRAGEIALDVVGNAPRRLVHPANVPRQDTPPKVSIHIPACREQPAVLRACLDSVAALDYPDFEVLVVINNTPDEALWKPIEAHCRSLGARFRFINLPHVDGFKAGALNAALDRTHPDAQVIAVVDADYRVRRHWLHDLVPLFQDNSVALVQAPQQHTDRRTNAVQRMMNCEYAGFFDIGMVHRNEANAIIAHGTMLLLRKDALIANGAWATDTIVEDTELGLRLLADGGVAHYTTQRYGQGILPDDTAAYAAQRQRWAYGAMQIIRKHWRALLPLRRGLTASQKWQFATGWLTWLSDSAATGLALLNLAATPLVLLGLVALPPTALIAPVFAACLITMLHTGLLYYRRVTRSPVRIAAAAIAAMSLQFTVTRAVLAGLLGRPLPFRRTPKGGPNGAALTHLQIARILPECILGFLLAAAATILLVNNPHGIPEQTQFGWLLAVQSLPFGAAVALQCLEIAPQIRPIASRLRKPATALQRPALERAFVGNRRFMLK
jgi:exo-beta-1,3-glucanase (GH17 family)/cellulose synthase/poly-beta-1,6-N-acetylglucosamine synthase-like glycosyltransferase